MLILQKMDLGDMFDMSGECSCEANWHFNNNIVPTIYILLQLSFTVSKRSSLSRTKVPHQVTRDLLSSESISSESAFRNSKSLIPRTGYIYFLFFHKECPREHSHHGLIFPPVYLDYYTLQMDQLSSFTLFFVCILTNIQWHYLGGSVSKLI